MNKKLKEESQMVARMDKFEDIVGTMDDTLKTLLYESIHTNQLLQKLFEAQLRTRDNNKKGEKGESLSRLKRSQIPTEEAAGQATKRKIISTQSQRDEERKRAKNETLEER